MNKLKYYIFIAVIFIVIFTSCAKHLDKYVPETNISLEYNLDTLDLSNVSQNQDYLAQIQVIANEINTWLIKNNQLQDINGYCVTDLDDNGLLEIIVSKVNNTTMLTTNNIYEVNNNLDGLTLIKWSMPDGSPGPTLMNDKIDVYIDNKNKSNIYICKTVLNINQYEYSENITTLILKDHKINQNFIGFKNVTAIDSKKNVDKIPELITTYTDGFGNVINAEQYDLMEADLYRGKNYISATATLNWITFNKKNKATISNIDSYNKNDLISKLNQSFDEFHIILN